MAKLVFDTRECSEPECPSCSERVTTLYRLTNWNSEDALCKECILTELVEQYKVNR